MTSFNKAMKFVSGKKRKKKGKAKSLLKLKPFDWGEGTEKSSVEIDEIIYGS